MSLTKNFIRNFRDVFEENTTLNLHEPYLGGNEWKYVKDCLDTGWVSTAGHYVEKFEKSLAEKIGVRFVVAVVNGTSALHACLCLLQVKEDEEVLLPSLTFVATANAVSYVGATPHFIDIAEQSLGICPSKLESYLKETVSIRNGTSVNKRTGRKIRVLIGVHAFGHPFDICGVKTVCERYHIHLVEDAAESLGSLYNGIHTGNWGVISALSFNGNKIATTGGGGAIVTNNENLAKAARHLTTTAKVTHLWRLEHDQIGYNYRMPSLNAALGCAQLEQLSSFVEKKRTLAALYQERLKDVAGIQVFKELSLARSNYWLNLVILDRDVCEERDALLDATNRYGFMTRPVWDPMHKLEMYRSCPRMDLSMTELMEKRILCLPSSVSLLQHVRVYEKGAVS